jgi:phosphodiesterase/alkaline phosphatase D-like protein
MRLIYEKSSSTHDLNRGRRTPFRAFVLVLFALAVAALSLTLPRPAQAHAEVLSAFSPAAEPMAEVEPAVTGAASAVTQSSATLNGTVNPNGAAVTECKFEYGTATNPYPSSVPCSQSLSSLGTGTSPVPVSAPVSALTPNTTYHFRLSAGGVTTFGKGADGTFKTLPPPAPTVINGPASALTQTTATVRATVNPNGGEVTKCEFEYGTTTAYGSAVQCSALPGSGTSDVPVSASLTGLAANTIYHLRLSATNAGGTGKSHDEVLKTLPNAPTVVTGAASSLTTTSATLNATVNPNGAEVGECEFEYGTTTAYGKTAPCATPPGSGSSPVAVSAPLTGLVPNTPYHFRISAHNSGGTGTGSDKTLETLLEPPTVVTREASSVTLTTATVSGTVNPNGAEVTECEFEYGTTNTYGASAPCSTPAGSGTSPITVSVSLTALAPNTTYHFRITAHNKKGTSKGADVTFTTALDPPTVATDTAAAVTQSSAMLRANVNPNGGEVSRCEFEYGTTSAYGSSVPCATAPGSGTNFVAVSASATGLAANTTYHFRITATNATGTSVGADETLTTLPGPAAPPGNGPPGGGTTPGTPAVKSVLPAPVLTRTANLAAIAGQVRVRAAGARTFVTLSSPRQISYPTVVDATHGEVSVTAANSGGGVQKGQFFDGEFVLSQGSNGRVLATLTGGNFSACSSRGRAAGAAGRSKPASRTHLVRRLWAEARGNFSTKGRYAGGIVQGAQWLTEDMCQGTLILTTRERVEVTDLVHHRHLQVPTGGIYLAKA